MEESTTGYALVLDHKIDGTSRTLYKSLDGKMEVEISETVHDKACSYDLMHRWIKTGYVSEWHDTSLTVQTYYSEDGKSCYGYYNPTARLSEDGKRLVIDFDWVLDATPENVSRILRECERMRREDIRIKPATV